LLSWIKRRLALEHRKLAWQNFRASHDPEMKTMAGLKGDWDSFDGYDSARDFSKYFATQLASGETLTPDDIDAALVMNKGLRALFDQHARKGRGAFDGLYRPLGGWKAYFEREDNEMHLIEHQKKIESDIEMYQRTGKFPEL